MWAFVVLANLSAMTIFLWHQTAMIAVTAIGMFAGGPLPGLHTVPDGFGWLLAAAGVRAGPAGVLGRVPRPRAEADARRAEHRSRG
ncbi:hypothetical protein Misp02_39350 [Microtetraspora sp. NBRC 16547]|nr:hypothetical protein Misp02_39350 [Microtetraspora sp. NBRC 16547]